MNENRADAQRLPNAIPEQNPVGALAGGKGGETQSRARVVVRIVRCSTRELDPDNLYGSVKAIIDLLRHCGLIENDSAAEIALDVSQMHVVTRKEHQTKITLEYEEMPALRDPD